MNLSFPEFVLLWLRWQGSVAPPIHRRISNWIARRLDEGERRLLLLAFRNSGKSTLLGLLAVWLVLRDPNHRVLVLAAEQALASKLTRFARRVLERHPLCAPLRERTTATSWSDDSFTVARSGTLRDPSILARGIGGNITGAHADTVICDDVEVPNTASTAARRAWLRQRLNEVEHIISPGGLQIYAGTPHTYYSIYAGIPRPESCDEQPYLHGFRRCVVPVLNKANESAWPERFPSGFIEDLRRRVGPSAFASQMLLKPQRPDGVCLDPEMLRLYDTELILEERNRQLGLKLGNLQLKAASAWWDPAFGARPDRDRSVVAVVFVDSGGEYWLHHIAYLTVSDRTDTDPATQQCREVARLAKEFYLPSLTLEANGIGGFLPGLLRRELARAGVSTAVISATSRTAKDIRIVAALEAPLAAGAIHAHQSVWETPFIEEMREWRPGAGGHKDGLDAVGGAIGATPVRLPSVQRPAHRTWASHNSVKAFSDFTV